MSRYTGPTTRQNRRFGQAIFAPNKAFERRGQQLPGQHGPRLRRKLSEYATGLLEKQKLRFAYGLTEKQFYLTFEEAKRRKGVTGEVFLQILESRLDNVIYSLGLAKSRAGARQLICHGHVKVNGKKVDIPSYRTVAGEIVEISDKTPSRQLATRSLEESRGRVVPAWLSIDEASLKGTVVRMPNRDEIDGTINEQLIVEFYSR